MDLRKTGKLIAEMRNKKGLTQQELGDLVGVGYRAVSKWERGLNLPDIGNINELSKIFSISSDEILNGELKEEIITEETTKEETINQTPKKKNSLKVKITISVVTIILLIIASLIIYNNNKTYVYDMRSANEDEYYVEGNVTLHGDDISIMMDKLQFKDIETAFVEIENYQYDIMINNNFIFGYGSSTEGSIQKNKPKINNFLSNFSIEYNGETNLNIDEVEKNNLNIILTMWDTDLNEIKKEIKILLYKK